MKKLLLLSLAVLLLAGCKKKELTPEGPTDVRLRNITTLNFTNVIVKTSEYDEDADTIASLPAGVTTSYVRFKKAYQKVQITAKTNNSGTLETYTLQTPFTYQIYVGPDMVTYEIFVSNPGRKELDVRIIFEGPITSK